MQYYPLNKESSASPNNPQPEETVLSNPENLKDVEDASDSFAVQQVNGQNMRSRCDHVAATIVELLMEAEPADVVLEQELWFLLRDPSWSALVAFTILDGVRSAFDANEDIIVPMTAMHKSIELATYNMGVFDNEKVMKLQKDTTLKALGVLAVLRPDVIEALGFTESGPILGSPLLICDNYDTDADF